MAQTSGPNRDPELLFPGETSGAGRTGLIFTPAAVEVLQDDQRVSKVFAVWVKCRLTTQQPRTTSL